jgi:beta-galactosidase
MLYMLRPGVAGRIRRFCESGGTLVATYWSGIADENDLCFLGGFPGPLRGVLGIWAEEIDALYEGDRNGLVPLEGNALGLSGTYEARELCDLIHAETAKVLATYASDFYAGRPALTVNRVGEGQAYYVASRNENAFLDDFYGALSAQLGVRRSLDAELPAGVSAQVRTDGEREYVFLMNYGAQPASIDLGDTIYTDLLSEKRVSGRAKLEVYGVMVLARTKSRKR